MQFVLLVTLTIFCFLYLQPLSPTYPEFRLEFYNRDITFTKVLSVIERGGLLPLYRSIRLCEILAEYLEELCMKIFFASKLRSIVFIMHKSN